MTTYSNGKCAFIDSLIESTLQYTDISKYFLVHRLPFGENCEQDGDLIAKLQLVRYAGEGGKISVPHRAKIMDVP